MRSPRYWPREWKEAQNGNLTQEQTIEIRTALVNSWVKKEKGTSFVENEKLEEEKKSMNEYLAVYGDYIKKRNAIIALGEENKQGKNEWEKKLIDEETKRQLSDLDIEVAKTTSAISGLFGDMKEKTLKELQDLSERGAEALGFLQSGSWSASKGAELGITKEQFDLVLRKNNLTYGANLRRN